MRLTKRLREVTLLSGEALFDVAKDPARPFRVRNDQVIAEALGTSFVVRDMPTQTVVTVIEGRVAITRPTQNEPIAADAGERASVRGEVITKLPVANTEAVTAWRSGRLVYDSQSLAEVVDEFNRYNILQMHVDDVQLSNERISGVFNADQPRSLARFLERTGTIEPLETSDGAIHLRPKR